MKKGTKIVLGVSIGVVVLVMAFIAIGMYGLFHSLDEQMETGRKAMDSLTDADFPVWIDRSQKLISEGPADTLIMSTDKRMPEELKQLKLLGIYIGQDYVTYKWLGGMERTDLQVQRTENGTFTITATYNEQESRVLWPKN
jgi:hypothetical protein